jgi:DNA-binding CsgD family transcriptional regulator
MNQYFDRLAQDDGAAHTRTDLIQDRSWYGSHDYQSIHKAFGVDHILWCFRSIDRGAKDPPDLNSGVVLNRAAGRGDFRARDRTVVREAHAALAALVGGALAGHDDPSPRDLPPRARQVLACLLEGDVDKQIAARLRLSIHTVNDYTKAIYRHFRVAGRTQLLARWVRRGWGAAFSWVDDDDRPPALRPLADESTRP